MLCKIVYMLIRNENWTVLAEQPIYIHIIYSANIYYKCFVFEKTTYIKLVVLYLKKYLVGMHQY